MKRPILLIATLIALVLPGAAAVNMRARAYARHGKTASGTRARRGVVAADPRIFPLGSKVKVTGAGRYDGHYRVEDTGRRVRGRRIDIFVPSASEARQFGARTVKVKLVERPRR